MLRFDPRRRLPHRQLQQQWVTCYLPQLRLVGNPPAELLPWLLATGSLTAKIEALTQQKLLVVPQFEGRHVLSLSEKSDLQLPLACTQSAWVRDALLYGKPDSEAWIMARSVFPFSSLRGDAERLTRLGNTPIGYVIFGRGGARLLQRHIRPTPNGWQRTSLYDWQGRRLLVSEIFLPTFSEFLNSQVNTA